MSAIDQLPMIPAVEPPAPAARRPVRRASLLAPAKTNRWTRWHACGAALMAALAVLAAWDAWSDIYRLAAKDEEYSHIFLVPVVAFCMVWVRRHRFRYCKPSATSLGFIIALAGWAITTIGYGTHNVVAHIIVWPIEFAINILIAVGTFIYAFISAIIDGGLIDAYTRFFVSFHAHFIPPYVHFKSTHSAWHGGAVLLLIGCVTSILGKHMLFRFFPAVAVLIFLIPVPGPIRMAIALPLQSGTARIVQFIYDLFNVPIKRNGNLLSLNNQPVNIGEACNGVRMVFALVLIGYAFCFGMALRNSVRFLILVVSPLVTIFCNVMRILPTIWIYGYHGRDVGDVFHTYSGWLMLPISFLLLLGFIKVLRWAMIPVMRYTLAS